MRRGLGRPPFDRQIITDASMHPSRSSRSRTDEVLTGLLGFAWHQVRDLQGSTQVEVWMWILCSVQGFIYENET